MITMKEIKEFYEYKRGKLYKRSNGKECGSIMSNGYVRMTYKYKYYMSHQLIYLYFKGYIPKVIDHIDRNRYNNRIENLRDVSQSLNMLNKVKDKRNKTGYIGVHKSGYRFISFISDHGVRKYLGSFKTPLEAALAYEREKKFIFERCGIFYSNPQYLQNEK